MSLSGNVSTSPRLLETYQSEMKQKMAYFNEVLKGAGFTPRYDELPHFINQEQALVSRDINKILRAHITYPNNSQEFMAGLKLLCDREIHFRRALSPTELKKLRNEEVLFNEQPMIPQDSLMRLILNVECLQSHVIEMLLEEITTAAANENNEDTSYLRLLLNPLRYLSHINDSKLLTTKLLDILEIATYTKQLEILNLIPEIIPDNEYEDTAKQLSKLLSENNELTAAIIDCLNSLNLTSDIREEIQNQILVILEASSSYTCFPILFEFLITDCDSKNLQGVLSITRNVLDTIMSLENSNKETEANKVLIFNRLQAFARAKRNLCDGWINLIVGIRSHSEHKPIDFLILFMLHSIGSSRKSAIEGIIRKRIKNGFFKISLLETLFQKYFVNQNFKDNLSLIIEIASNMLRFYSDGLLVEFSSTIFVLLFNHELIDYTQRQDIVYNLILLIGRSDKKSATPILNVLILFLDNFERLQQYTVQLMGLLEKSDAVELKDVKSIFHILCSLTCSCRVDNSVSGLKDEIHMIVRKQLSSCKKTIKHQGIVAAVTMAKILVVTTQEQMDSEQEDSITLDDLPQGPPQEAASLVLLANTCTLGSSDSVGLYYDQLAAMLVESAHNLNNYFVSWLYGLITNDFQNIFITETTPDPIDDIMMSMQYSLNNAEEMDSPIAVKIAELTLKSQNYTANSILTLAPIFRLLRLIHFRQHNGDLSTIDALLGSSVLMPDLKDIEIYDFYQLRQIADCIFHCINWFREIISAFVTQKNKKLRNKVMQRLADVVELEELLEKCLARIPDHKFPISYFDMSVQSSKQGSPTKSTKNIRPTKKQKISDTMINADETIASTSAAVTQQTKSSTSKKKVFKEINVEKISGFRDMDTDIILLIRYPMKLDLMNVSLENMDTQKTTLSLNQGIFLLDDLVSKLTTLNKSKPHNMIKLNAVNLITDCVHFLPNINKHLNTVILGLNDLLQEDTLETEELHTGLNSKLKIAFNLILKTYASIFAWSGFQHTKHSGLLKDCLKALKNDQASQLFSIKGLVNEFTVKLLGYVKYCLYLPAAISLVEIMQTLHVISPNVDLKKRISTTSGKLLTKPWYNLRGELETGKSASLGIDFLVKSYLGGANVKTVCSLVGTLQNQVSELKSKEDNLPMLGSINKANFYLFYRCLGVTLLECVRNEITSLTNNQHLVLWRTTALTMQGLMTVVKNQETKTNLISYLKNSIGILKVFLASGIPILEIMLRSKTDEVVEIFKIMQTSTRFLHHLCCYSKFTKDSGLVAYVPQFRLLLESLLYRVKAALVANDCSAAFWMGTLRNRDLHGEDILSQSSLQTNESNEEEELPPDESEEEADEIIQNDRTTEQGDGDSSGSDIF